MERFAGIDIGSGRHVVALVDDLRAVLIKPKPFVQCSLKALASNLVHEPGSSATTLVDW